jgi:hypothetical protein
MIVLESLLGRGCCHNIAASFIALQNRTKDGSRHLKSISFLCFQIISKSLAAGRHESALADITAGLFITSESSFSLNVKRTRAKNDWLNCLFYLLIGVYIQSLLLIDWGLYTYIVNSHQEPTDVRTKATLTNRSVGCGDVGDHMSRPIRWTANTNPSH